MLPIPLLMPTTGRGNKPAGSPVRQAGASNRPAAGECLPDSSRNNQAGALLSSSRAAGTPRNNSRPAAGARQRSHSHSNPPGVLRLPLSSNPVDGTTQLNSNSLAAGEHPLSSSNPADGEHLLSSHNHSSSNPADGEHPLSSSSHNKIAGAVNRRQQEPG